MDEVPPETSTGPASYRYACTWHGHPRRDIDLSLGEADSASPKTLATGAQRLGLAVKVVKEPLEKLGRHGSPALLFGRDGEVWVFDPALGDHGKIIQPRMVADAGANGDEQDATTEKFTFSEVDHSAAKRSYFGWAMLLQSADDEFSRNGRTGAAERGGRWGWFWSAVLTNRRDGLYILGASILINLFAIAMPLFTRVVYDRVIPNSAVETLWVLATGVAIIFSFDFLTRILRGRFVDLAGKSIDHVLARRVYHHALSIDLTARPSSAGSFASNLRGYETVREFLGAATVLALIDVPISLLMIGLVFWLAGPVGWIPVVAVVAVLVAAVVVQPMLRGLMRESYAKSIHRQALMVETANGLETVKAANAEGALERKMAEVVTVAEEIDLRMRKITQFGMAFTAFCINSASIAVIVASVFRIQSHDLTMGGLIACSMVVGRAMAPLSGVASLLMRLQQTLSALDGLNSVMKLPKEGEHSVLRKPIRFPEIVIRNVTFTYPRQPVASLQGISLKISPGERVGIIGRAGAGKSTLLRLLSRLHLANEGLVLLDGVDIAQWPGHAVRQKFGYLPQDGTLFHGNVRENITLGNPAASDADMLKAAEQSCVLDWVNNHPMGFQRPIGEHGVLISGGQRQSILLARCFLNQPDVLLLDEPSDGFDLTTEKRFRLSTESYLNADPRRTLVLATHKPTLLQLVNRLVLIDGGRVLADGPKERVLEMLQAGNTGPAKPAGPENAGRPAGASLRAEPNLSI